jgi:acetyl esterase/lipase
MRRLVALVVLSGALSGAAAAQGPDPVLLWPDGAPGAMGDEDGDKPSIRIYQPEENKTGTVVVVCPGGGYGALATDHEGHQVAKWFNTFGVTAAVLKYRLGPKYHHPAPLEDVSRAVRYMRAHADELGTAADRVGVMGFSAGGHLASTVSTHFDAGKADSNDPIDRASSRPDFSILCYPVISLVGDFSHRGSAKNLLGENPDPALLESLSNDTQVTDETPPTFLFHTGEDKGVPVQNCLVYYRALVEHGVPAELHVYQNGPHGVGLAPGDPVLSTWKERLHDWLQVNGFLGDTERAEVSGTVTLNGVPLRWGTIAFIPDDDRLPSAFAMISQGKYSFVPASSPAVGTYNVVVYNLGTVEPRPTIEDASAITRLNPDGRSSIKFEVASGKNECILDLIAD